MIKRLRSTPIAVFVMLATIALTINLSHESVTKDTQASNPQPSLQDIREHLGRIEDAMKEVKRDELNYRMEKDLLKEAYASNLQTINTVITIVLGMFTVIGFLGVKSILQLQQAYRDKLDELSKLAAGFQAKFQEIETEQQKLKTNSMNSALSMRSRGDVFRFLNFRRRSAGWWIATPSAHWSTSQ